MPEESYETRREALVSSIANRYFATRRNWTFSISTLALEQCNRMCQHCFVDANPSLAIFSFSNIAEWIPGKAYFKISATIGEPFFYNDRKAGKDLGDVVELVLSANPTSIMEIVTSGINFANSFEKRASEKIASLPEEIRMRLKFTLSVSEFPLFGKTPAAAAQADSIIYFLENGFPFTVFNTLPKEDFENKVLLPVLNGVGGIGALPAPGDLKKLIDRDCIEEKKTVYTAKMDGQGKGMLIMDERAEGFVPGPGLSSSPCLFTSNTFQLRHDGSIGPGCCMFTSPFIDLAKIDDTGRDDKIQSFVRALRWESAADCSKGACMHCLRIAKRNGLIRAPERLKNLEPGISRKLAL